MTETITSAIGDYGLYAVFLLMLVDAVFPAASELVMLYAGAVAAGAFAGHHVTVFGEQIDSTFWAYVAMATAGTVGYVIGSLIGWGIGFYGGRPFLERRGKWVHVTPEGLDRAEAWFARYGDWATLAYTNAKVRENYSRRFRITFPNEELPAGRPLHTTPVYDRLTAHNAVWGAGFGLEHPLWFQRPGEEPRNRFWMATAAAPRAQVWSGSGRMSSSQSAAAP